MFAVVPRHVRWSHTGLALALGLLAGTALQLRQAVLSPWWVYAALLPFAWFAYRGVLVYRPWGRGAGVVVGLVGMAATWSLTGLRAVVFVSQALNPALEGQDLLVTGVVADMPQPTETGLRFRLATETAVLDGQVVPVPGLLDIGWYSNAYNRQAQHSGLQRSLPDVRAGQRWRLPLRLKAPHGSINPHGFDYELYLWGQGVQATGYVRTGASAAAPRLLAQTWRAPVARLRQWVRTRIEERVPDVRVAGLLAALVVGDQRAIERSDWDVFRATGVSHLVSISGLHITMFAWAATAWVGWLWRRSARLCQRVPAAHAAWVGGVLLAMAYAVFSGWGVPAQRTCLMLVTVVLLRLQGARWPWPWVALWTAVIVLLWDPWALLQAGFWLSFVAVGLLFLATQSLSPMVDMADRAGGLPARWGRAAIGMLREQWVISLGLAPLVLLLFGQVSLVGLLANALAIPWVTLVITPLSLAGVLWPDVWTVATGAVALFYAGLDVLAAWPWATWSMPLPPLALGLGAVAGGVLLVLPMPLAVRAMGLTPVLACLLWRPPAPAPGEFSLLAADIGQGNAVLVQTARHALLFDAGPRYSLESDAGNRVLLPLLQALDLRLDRVVLSHRDSDHVGGATAVLGMQPQAELLSSIDPDHPLQQLRKSRPCQSGMRWWWDGVQFEFLHPDPADYLVIPPPEPNALSCVLRISNGRQVALLTGDIEAGQEQRLLQNPELAAKLRADVLLVPHHGSKTSSSLAFLQAVQPRHALVQAGYRNRYGHPAAQVVARYAELRINLVSSPRCGAAHWRSGEPQNVACMREDDRRYWSHDVP